MVLSWFDRNPSGYCNLKGGKLIWFTSVLSNVGFCLIGYGNGLLGGIITQEVFKRRFDYPGTNQIGFITSIYGIGAFVGAVLTAVIGDGLGRRKCICIGSLIMFVSCFIQTYSSTINLFSLGRFINGVGLGILNSTIPVLQNDISPSKIRGKFVAIYCTMLNIGIVLAYLIDFSLFDLKSNQSWQIPIICQVFLLIPIFLLSMIVSESPRWLLSKNDDSNALIILANLYDSTPDDAIVCEEFDTLKEAVLIDQVNSETSSFWNDFYNSDDLNSSKRLWMSLSIQIFQQLGGINILIFYTSILFENSIKLSPKASSQMSVVLQVWLVITSTIPWRLIDEIGRKPLILFGIFGQSLSMLLQSTFVYYLDNDPNNNHIWSILSITTLFLFEASFTIGMQATVWVYCSEILPLRLRSRGTSLATSVNWIFSSLLIQLAPTVLETLGSSSFLIISSFNLFFLPMVYFFFKETKGLTLEEIDNLFI